MKGLCYFILFLAAFSIIATQKQSQPIYLTATQVSYNQTKDIATATGQVTASDGVEIIECDKLIYDKKTTLIIATGNVRYFTKTNDIIYTDYIEVTDNFKYALMEEFAVLMEDESRLTGKKAEKHHEVSFIHRGMFSPCYLCKEDPTAPPVWALKASTVKQNKPYKIIEYYNAHMEFLGIPIFYTPYFHHPDPSVKRRSGFLFPRISRSSRYGLAVGIPYYWVISPSEDVTLTPYPVLEGGSGNFLHLEHRKHFGFGKIHTHASLGYTRNRDRGAVNREIHKRKLLGHLFSDGSFAIDELWRLRYKLQKMDSQTYLKRFAFLDSPTQPITTANTLDSHFHLERFDKNSYADISGYWFQDLRESESRKNTPAIIPSLYYQYVTDPGTHGEVWQLTLANIFLTRPEGVPGRTVNSLSVPAKVRELNRFVIEGQFYIPYITPDGSEWSLKANLNGRLYSFYGYRETTTKMNRQGTEGAVFPQLTLGWHKPYFKFFNSEHQIIIDPTVNSVTSSLGANKNRLPNEDSQEFEFTTNNLFTSNRFSGLDRLDEGSRLNYGVHVYYRRMGRSIAHAFVGQSYSFNDYSHLQNPGKKGLYKKFSDYLASIYISPLQNYSLDTSFLLDRNDFKPKRISSQFIAGPDLFKITATYTYIKNRTANTPTKPLTHQINLGVSSVINKEWSLSSEMGYDMVKPKRVLYVNLNLDYKNECFGLLTTVKRTFFRSRTLRPQTIFLLTFSFKHIGTFGNQFVADKSTS
jgi:LPS-assembly protein